MTFLGKYANGRQWLRGLAKHAIHSGTGTVLSVFGTNGAEQLAPEALAGIGLTLAQALAVFAVSSLLGAVRFVHETTDTTPPPFDPPHLAP